MPYARTSKSKRTFKKRPTFKRSFKKRFRPARPSGGNLLGNKILANHRLALTDSTNFNPGAGGIATYDICANAQLNDPSGSIGPGQVRGYDQMGQMYGSWNVIGSRLKVTFIAPPGATITPMVGITLFKGTPQSPSDTLTTIPDYKENRFTKLKLMKISSTDTGTCTMYYKFSPKRVLGKRTELGDLQQGQADAEGAYSYRIFAFAATESQDVAIMTLQVQVEYLVVWSNPINSPGS